VCSSDLLEKNLPVASGIGGGSADAAAVLSGLKKLWGIPKSIVLGEIGAQIGADVPMCLVSKPLRARGIGEDLTPLALVNPLHFVLVNPGEKVSTPAIFRALTNKNNDGIHLPNSDNIPDFGIIEILRNDLQSITIDAVPVIGKVIAELQLLENVKICRMSGSGATCFGIFDTASSAEKAALLLSCRYPDWWVIATSTLNGDSQENRG